LTPYGRIARAAVVSLVRLRLAQDAGAGPNGLDWQADLREVQTRWEWHSHMPKVPVLAIAVDGLHRRATDQPAGPDRDRVITDYASGTSGL
jgi:hypothetical protein